MAGVAALVGTLVGSVVLAGCSSDVAVEPSRGADALSGAQVRACEQLVAGLPDRVGDLPQRRTTGNPLGAAWGDPAVVLRCGVETPDDFTPTSVCQDIDGVLWFVPEGQIADQGADVVATTMATLPRVEVAIPAELRPPQGILTDLSDALREQVGTPDPDVSCS